jgi:periplasmic protein TonB
MATKPPSDDDKTTPFIRDGEEPQSSPAATPASPPADLGPAPAPRPLDLQRRNVVGASFTAAHAAGTISTVAVAIIVAVVFVHVGMIGFSYASSIWAIDRLDRPKDGISDIALAPPPPPPPPPPPGGAKPKTQTITPKKRTVKDIVQPVKIEKQETKVEETGGDPAGEEGGVEGGEAGGVVGGEIGSVLGAPPPPPPPPPPPAPPQNVPPTILEGQRVAGNKHIVPSEVTKTAIQRSGKSKIVGSFKLCLTTSGTISSINMLKSTGFPDYDGKIQTEMRSWRYRPYLVNGKAVPVCTAVTFIYSQS